jgi:hypothetical protein
MSKVRATGAVAAVAVFFGGVWSQPWGPEWLFRAVGVGWRASRSRWVGFGRFRSVT